MCRSCHVIVKACARCGTRHASTHVGPAAIRCASPVTATTPPAGSCAWGAARSRFLPAAACAKPVPHPTARPHPTASHDPRRHPRAARTGRATRRAETLGLPVPQEHHRSWRAPAPARLRHFALSAPPAPQAPPRPPSVALHRGRRTLLPRPVAQFLHWLREHGAPHATCSQHDIDT